MISLNLIILFLLVHWFADFILQTDWQAKNKSKNIIALSNHIFSYSFVILILAFYLFNPYLAIIYTLINGSLHFITDYCTSKIGLYFWNKGDTHNFFVMIGFDQILHYICLFGTYLYFA